MTAPTAAWLEHQRWFAGKGASVEPEAATTTAVSGGIEVSLLEVGGQCYQLVSGGEAPDALDDPATGQALLRALRRGGSSDGPAGRVSFHLAAGVDLDEGSVRPIGVEQSNTSLVVGDEWIFKVFRRVQDGTNPELEVLRFLAGRGAAHVPRLAGWYEIERDGRTRTLGVLQALVPGAVDGWTWLLERLRWQPEATIEPLHRLGAVLAEVHAALATGGPDEGFGAVDGGPALARSIARGIATDVERTRGELAGQQEAQAALATATSRAQELAVGLDAGPAIRVHGDLHLGQVLMSADGWTVIDWEGEPSRPIVERRAHQPALRDLAGLLRSLAYAAATTSRTSVVRPLDGWLAAARASVLDGYFDAVDPALLPAGAVAARQLLDLMELEKLVYEIGYEAANRPTWIDIPLSGLRQTLRSEVA